MFKNVFSFDGRIRRLEYGLSFLIYILVLIVIAVIVDLLGATGSTLATGISLLIYIPLFWFLLAQGAKRCHDRGNSGWWQIIPFYYLWMLFADGEIGDNEYGENPKGLSYANLDSETDDKVDTPIDDVDEDGSLT